MCMFICLHIRVCAHVFVISALCPLKLVRHTGWQAIRCVYVQMLLCMVWLRCSTYLWCRLEERWDNPQGRWSALSPVLLGQVFIPGFYFPLLALECWRELGHFEGEVPAESLVTRQPWARTINWNHFHLPCNCNDSQLVSWFKFRGFPLSAFLSSAFPIGASCSSLSQSVWLSPLPSRKDAYLLCSSVESHHSPKGTTAASVAPVWLLWSWVQVTQWETGPRLSFVPASLSMKHEVWVCFPESSPSHMFAQCQKGCQF